jgi:uncharacterized protein YdaU (DUF1376 family)
MGKHKTPWPLFSEEFYMDTNDWSAEEVGIYTRLLMTQWANKYLRNDMGRLARIAGVSLKRFQKGWSTIRFKFHLSDDNKLQNLKMEEVRKEQFEYRKKQVMSGIKGAEVRWCGHVPRDSDPIGDPNGETHGEQHGETMASNYNSNYKEDILVKVADAPFELPTKEEITEASPIKTISDMDNVCTQLYEENVFPDVHAFKNKMLKAGKNEKAILHALCRCYLSKPEEPWGFCKTILDVEDGNYNERDHAKTSEEK